MEEKEKPVEATKPVEEVKVEETVTAEPVTGEPAVERKPRDLFYERVRTNFPDAKYDDDEEEYFRGANSMMDDFGKKAESYETLTKQLMERFQNNPDEAQAFIDYLEGMSLPAAIRKNMGDEALTMKEGDEGWEAYQEAGNTRKKQFEEQQALIEKIHGNAAESDKAFAAFVEENGLDEAGQEELKGLIQSFVEKFSLGNVDKDTLAMLKRQLDYDKDVAGAREQGQAEGRNEAIEAKRKTMEGSGLPSSAGGGASAKEEIVEQPQSDMEKMLGKLMSRRNSKWNV